MHNQPHPHGNSLADTVKEPHRTDVDEPPLTRLVKGRANCLTTEKRTLEVYNRHGVPLIRRAVLRHLPVIDTSASDLHIDSAVSLQHFLNATLKTRRIPEVTTHALQLHPEKPSPLLCRPGDLILLRPATTMELHSSKGPARF